MYSALALNYGHLARACEANPYFIQLYYAKNDYDTDSKLSQRQLSFDAGLANEPRTSTCTPV